MWFGVCYDVQRDWAQFGFLNSLAISFTLELPVGLGVVEVDRRRTSIEKADKIRTVRKVEVCA